MWANEVLWATGTSEVERLRFKGRDVVDAAAAGAGGSRRMTLR
jgi:hypothetical protein